MQFTLRKLIDFLEALPDDAMIPDLNNSMAETTHEHCLVFWFSMYQLCSKNHILKKVKNLFGRRVGSDYLFEVITLETPVWLSVKPRNPNEPLEFLPVFIDDERLDIYCE